MGENGNETKKDQLPDGERVCSGQEIHKYVSGLKRYRDRGIPIYVDGRPSGPDDWEKLFGPREEGAFYMGDFVETETGELKEIRFDKVYYK